MGGNGPDQTSKVKTAQLDRGIASAQRKKPSPPVTHPLLQLQQTAGNQVVLQLVQLSRRLEVDFGLLESDAAFNAQQHKIFLEETHGFAGIISDILGDTVPPHIGIWTWPRPAIEGGREALKSGRLAVAAKQLQLAQESLGDAKREWNSYVDKTTGGAGKAVTALTFTRDISFAIAIGTAAVVAAPVVAGVLAGSGGVTTGSALATGALVATGGAGTGAILRGGSSAVGQAMAGGGINYNQVITESVEGAKRGAVDASSALVGFGAGKALGLGVGGIGAGKQVIKGGLAGAAGGATGGAFEATLEGKTVGEILKAGGKGALAGTVGGTFGSGASQLSMNRSPISKALFEIVGDGGGGAVSTALLGGSPEDIRNALLTSVISGRVTGLAAQQGKRPGAGQLKQSQPGALPAKNSGLELDLEWKGEGVRQSNRDFEPQIDLTKPSGMELVSEKGRKKVPRMRPARPAFGEPSKEQAGTQYRKGMFFHEYNEAELVHGLRIDYDPVAGRPRLVSYRVDADVIFRKTQSERGFAKDRSVEGPQSSQAAYKDSQMDKGHLAQREIFRGSKTAERSADLMPGVVPMTVKLNRGARSPWRAAEERTIDYVTPQAQKGHGFQAVQVEVEPIYDAKSPRLRDGTPIPAKIRRMVKTMEGQVLEDITFINQ